MTKEILKNINSSNDVKNLSIEDMKILSDEIRQGILNRVNKIGGHLGPDLGIVEATIAMHYVFDCPKDKFVFDVSHQIYPHKMLTNRKQGFISENSEELFSITGYSNPAESPCDNFVIGHTSTSVSLATGLAKARDLKNENYNVIALIGDGSLSGGEAFEGLNNGGCLNSNFIVIVNDNEMSIAENHGSLYKNLEELRNTNGASSNNYFKALGYEYFYVEDGNDISSLIDTFKKVKNTTKPTVVHIHTLKGKGYKQAQDNKENYHWCLKGFLENKPSETQKTYASITKEFILNKKANNDPVVAVVAGTPGVFEYNEEFRNKLGKNYTDVAIAEEHAVAYASALAKAGAKPILSLTSSFIQRTYDQLSQDLALNNSPAVILVYWGGISPMDATHTGVFDIPMISNIPNIVYLAPTNKEEYLAMLSWAYEQNEHPVAIRVPFYPLKETGKEDTTDYSILNKSKIEKQGEKVAIIAVGHFMELAYEIEEELKKMNITPTIINPKYISGIDEKMLADLKQNHKLVLTLEDGVLNGGYGEKISGFYANSNMSVLNYGAKKEFTDRVSLNELYNRYHLTKELITKDIKDTLAL